MPRHPKPSDLNLYSINVPTNGAQPGPTSSPMNLQGVDLGSFGGDFQHDLASGLTPLPRDRPMLSPSPPGSPRQPNRETSFLSSFKSKKGSPKEETKKETRPLKGDKDGYRPATSSMSKIYHLRNNGSTPELSLVGSNENVSKASTEGERPPLPIRPQPTQKYSEDSLTGAKQKDRKIFPRVKRTTSMRRDSGTKPRPSFGITNGVGSTNDSFDSGPKTAPMISDWPGSDSRMKGKDKDRRGVSAERAPASESEENLAGPRSLPKEGKSGAGLMKNAFMKGMSGVKQLGNLGRQKSSQAKDIPDSEYVIKVINLPLVEQTRATRISKDLSQCRDKTEYWMPALPWRCIDFLNTNCEEEGLYRIPGSGPQVKHWQRRFDTELDIDLLDQDIGDTNEIASMLKAWFREQPTEVMPAEMQKRVGIELERQNPNYKNVGQEAPQVLRDALSELPPFNYYLLFAITCHLSLLLTNKDRNKMDLNNLAVCVGPCLNLERWLFNYLVADWRHCWQGCFTEKEYLNVERMVEEGVDPNNPPPHPGYHDVQSLHGSVTTSTLDDSRSGTTINKDERAISSGSSNKPASSYDSRTVSHGTLNNLHSHKTENPTPQTYQPAGAKYSNGHVDLGIDQDNQRPSTAQGGVNSKTMTGMNDQTPSTIKTRSNSGTPKVGGHGRSRSDLPPTPVKTNADYGFPVRPPSRPPSRNSARRA